MGAADLQTVTMAFRGKALPAVADRQAVQAEEDSAVGRAAPEAVGAVVRAVEAVHAARAAVRRVLPRCGARRE